MNNLSYPAQRKFKRSLYEANQEAYRQQRDKNMYATPELRQAGMDRLNRGMRQPKRRLRDRIIKDRRFFIGMAIIGALIGILLVFMLP